MIRTLRTLAVVLGFACLLAAQEKLIVEQPVPAVLRLGDTARVIVTIEGNSANPRDPKLPEVDGLQMALRGPGYSRQTHFDGRNLVERVSVQYAIELKPTRPGVFEIPSFPIWTGTKEQRTPVLKLEARQDMAGAELGWLEVHVEPQRVYVHEPVRVRVDFAVVEGLRLALDVHNRTRYLDLEVQAPWLDGFSGGERIDVPPVRGETRTCICNRTLVTAAFDGSFERDGKRYQKFTIERAFLPTRLGRIELSAPLLRFNVVQGATRPDVFGRSRARTENYFVYGEPLAIEVLPIPEQGRPTPFYGAVGRFEIAASVDRQKVRVGDSIKLTLVVSGRGNIEFLRMPELEQLDGFHKLGSAEVVRADGKVVVTYDLTPLSADVQAIPPIAWNYFDTTPGVERFVEVQTEPIPLQVEALPDGGGLAPLADEAEDAVTPGVDDVFDLPPLDGEPVRLVEPPRWLTWLAAVGPWVLVLLAFVSVRRYQRRRADVTGQRVRSAYRRFEAALRRGEDVLDALVGYLGDRLDVPPAAVVAPDLHARLVAAGLDAEIAREAVELVERGTAQRYGGGGTLPVDSVRALVQRLEGIKFGAGRCLPLLLVPLLWCASPLPAQQQEAVAAYRNGDYAAADRGFAAAYEATGDRRLLRARGNCLFRMGDYARARWAYECARLGLPRDPELAADLKVVRRRLELPEPPMGFGAQMQALLEYLTAVERLLACAALLLVAATCLLFGWRRLPLRWLGFAALVPGLWLQVAILWWLPSRPPRAVALEPLALRAEPRADLAVIARVRPGVVVEIHGNAAAEYARVAAGDHVGYVPSSALAIIR